MLLDSGKEVDLVSVAHDKLTCADNFWGKRKKITWKKREKRKDRNRKDKK